MLSFFVWGRRGGERIFEGAAFLLVQYNVCDTVNTYIAISQHPATHLVPPQVLLGVAAHGLPREDEVGLQGQQLVGRDLHVARLLWVCVFVCVWGGVYLKYSISKYYIYL